MMVPFSDQIFILYIFIYVFPFKLSSKWQSTVGAILLIGFFHSFSELCVKILNYWLMEDDEGRVTLSLSYFLCFFPMVLATGHYPSRCRAGSAFGLAQSNGCLQD